MGDAAQGAEKHTILIVDDEPYVLRVLKLKFENAGFRVMTAVNGSDGLDKLKRERPKVVISDQNMPRMTGIELMEASKEFYRENPFLLIFLTSTTNREELDLIQESANTLFISKPFSPKQILKIVSNYIDREEGEAEP